MSSNSTSMQPSLEEIMRQAMAERGQEFKIYQNEDTIPDSSGPNEEWEEEVLQGPDNPEGYNISLPPGLQHDPDLEKKARQWMHTGRIPQGMVNGLLQEYYRHVMEEADDETLARRGQEAEAQLRKEWGAAFDDNIASIQSLLQEMDQDGELHDLIEDMGLDSNVWFLKSLAMLAGRKRGTTE